MQACGGTQAGLHCHDGIWQAPFTQVCGDAQGGAHCPLLTQDPFWHTKGAEHGGLHCPVETWHEPPRQDWPEGQSVSVLQAPWRSL
jgi:hypothetical protein